jgi:hypothetical protein
VSVAAFLDLVQRRVQAGSGSDLWHLLEDPVEMREWWKVAQGQMQAAGIRHAVIGGVAVIRYMPQRETRDLDFGVAVQDAPVVRQRVAALGWKYVGPLRAGTYGGSAWDTPQGNHVDILYLPDALAQELLAAAEDNRFDGMPTATLSHMVLLKLESGRGQDVTDVMRMMGHRSDAEVAQVRRFLVAHRYPDMEDYDQTVLLGRLEYGKPRRKRRG